MYSYEARMKAIDPYLKNGHKAHNVIQELGYPERHMLLLWYKEYQASGELHKSFAKRKKYSDDQKRTAVRYYEEHGHSIKHTIQDLGYPSATMLKNWIHELHQDLTLTACGA